jgi:hypothetical protein
MQIALDCFGQDGVQFVDPAMQAYLVPFRDDTALLDRKSVV